MKRKELDSEKDRTKAKDGSQGAGCPSQLRKAGDLELEGGCSGFQTHLYPGFQVTHSSWGETNASRQGPPERRGRRSLRKGMSGPALTGQDWSLGGWGRAPDPRTAGWQPPEHAT